MASAGTDIDYRKGLALFLLVYLALAAGTARLHYEKVGKKYHDRRVELHEQALGNRAPAPVQYRVPVFYLAEGLQRAGVPFDMSYALVRGAFTFLAAVLLHLFLMRWFTPAGAFMNTLLFFAVLPATYFLYYMQPQDPPNLVFFIAGLWLVRDRRDALFGALLLLSMFNRETTVMLVAVFVLYRHDELPLPSLLVRAGIFAAIAAGVYVGLREYFGAHPYYSEFFIYKDNFTYWQTYAGIATAVGVFVVLPWAGLSGKPKFLARAAGMIPFFMVVHWTVTRMYEPRLFLPLVPVIFPLGLMTLFPGNAGLLRAPDAPRMDPIPEPTPVNGFTTRRPVLSYAIVFAVFIAVFAAFCRYNADLHLRERTARELVNSASVANRAGDNDRAERLLLEAVELDPENALARVSLGIVYLQENRLEQARAQFAAALELDPDGPYAEQVRGQLRALERRGKTDVVKQ